jgi:hypothetical protein
MRANRAPAKSCLTLRRNRVCRAGPSAFLPRPGASRRCGHLAWRTPPRTRRRRRTSPRCRLEEHEVAGAGELGKVLGPANFALTYLKLLWSALAFNASWEMNGSELTRTLSTAVDGEWRDITVTVKLDIGNAQVLNCLRLVSNVAGLDFSLWNDGPIENAGVAWRILEGGPAGMGLGYIKFPDDTPDPFHNRVTDDKGRNTIRVTGRKQSKVILNPERVDKTGRVNAEINLKSANIIQDLIDAAGGAGPAGWGTLTVPAEMIYRTGVLFFNRSFHFPVIDWEDCDASASANGIRPLAANVCSNTWSGTASFTMGAAANGPATSASVKWVWDRIEGTTSYYKPTGTANFTTPNCIVIPSAVPMSTQPGGGTGGTLAIDFGADPPTYQAMGASTWQATYECAPDYNPSPAELGAGGIWLADPTTFQYVNGTVAIDDTTHNLIFSGSLSGVAGSTTWNFSKD